ncbi:response regulator [Nostoc sp. PCC 7107]|uniref:response regulator n=1 Tax=Nostoc sp. PCC 7107 TaxID=317936 RepID=UPI00029EC8F8|nr:response regulator [Nostoc sp. PCC 7107]AFY44030.1 hypothetical protein Nos7107_3455 [Nostoc sp. PCC 7107]
MLKAILFSIPRYQQKNSLASARILIVEDEILVAREIESYLHKIGYEVVSIIMTRNTVIQQVIQFLYEAVLNKEIVLNNKLVKSPK